MLAAWGFSESRPDADQKYRHLEFEPLVLGANEPAGLDGPID
jgi:hypothetical protein